MISPGDTLLKYDNPVLSKTRAEGNSSKGHLRVSSQSSDDSTVTPSPPKPKYAPEMKKENILDRIHPPREWTEGNELCVQKVSSVPCTRADVLRLRELLDTKLQERKARPTGICPVRRELFSQCFDELIRQVTIMCAEMGLLLLRVRDEINMTFDAFHTLYVSSIGFGMRKAMCAETEKIHLEKRIADLENGIQDLTKQLNEQKIKYDELEKTKAEERRVQENNFIQKIRLLEEKNQQLQNLLEEKFTPTE
uniref:Axonemal dynein light intermediate polypeptide 1 n=1 Tax=Austrofundulus limnaeus TaxID=52670 RepID=A0A2I4C242_AUSLI